MNMITRKFADQWLYLRYSLGLLCIIMCQLFNFYINLILLINLIYKSLIKSPY